MEHSSHVLAMLRSLAMVLAAVASVIAINRPVFKINLTQKGFTQGRFQVCLVSNRGVVGLIIFGRDNSEHNLNRTSLTEQGNNRVVRLWLDSKGNLRASFDGKAESSTPANIAPDVWRHLCISYQSDYGAWALYLDGHILSCETSKTLAGYIIPGGGSLIIGYGTSNNGKQNGLEGEIFGASMIIASTIEANQTLKFNRLLAQKPFQKNKIKSLSNDEFQYMVLNNLREDQYDVETKPTKPHIISHSSTKSFIKISTPNNTFEHDVGLHLNPNSIKNMESLITENDEKQEHTSIWNMEVQSLKNKIYKAKKTKEQQLKSISRDLPTISEFETPPSPNAPKNDYLEKSLEIEKPPSTKAYKINDTSLELVPLYTQNQKEISEFETPPPPMKDNYVYGQWTNSKFSVDVLDYLKSMTFNNKDQKKVPPTIPLKKISDSYPYPNDFKINKFRPYMNLQRRTYLDQRHPVKRDVKKQEINVKIVENDIRSQILEQHAQTQPKHVEIISRGESNQSNVEKFHEDIKELQRQEASNAFKKFHKPKPFRNGNSNVLKHKTRSKFNIKDTNHLLSILPFLKSSNYYLDDPVKNIDTSRVVNSDDMYSKSLSSANKWHNIKSFSNDFTPQKLEFIGAPSIVDQKIAEANKQHPYIRLKYNHDEHTIKTEDPDIAKGREIAKDVSKQSKNVKSVSLFKYNHGYLPSLNEKNKITEKNNFSQSANRKSKSEINEFETNVKIGNALNEREVLGTDDEKKQRSFVGGDENIPDIHTYRSDIDNVKGNVPSSLDFKTCNKRDFDARTLYIHKDGSVDATYIESPLRKEKLSIYFITVNYKRCSLEESSLAKSPLLFIDWNKTPVRLFGGALPKKTMDLCGFF